MPCRSSFAIQPLTSQISVCFSRPLRLSRFPRAISCAGIPHDHTLDASSVAGQALGLLATLADSADVNISVGEGVADAALQSQNSAGFLAPISNSLESVLKTLQEGLVTLHVPYSYGFAIILLTLLVKVVTYPFTKKQVESSIAMQNLKPRIDNIKLRYGDDKDKVQRETSILYEEAGVDPTAGCFPSLATIPILWGLYRTLSNVASEGLLDSEGFFWIPTLGGPTTIASRQAGSGISWLWPLEDGAPPIGWEEAAPYLVLPILLVVCQYVSSSIIQPPVDPNADEDSGKWTQYLFKALPLLVGYFSLTLPSGLSLYYFSNIVLTSGQQIYLRKGGGADIELNDLGPITKLGMGRRTGDEVLELPPLRMVASASTPESLPAEGSANGAKTEDASSPDPNSPSPAPGPNASSLAGIELLKRTRCKRKRVDIASKPLVVAAQGNTEE